MPQQNLFKLFKFLDFLWKSEFLCKNFLHQTYIQNTSKIFNLILSFRANNKLDNTSANSNASKQIYPKCIILHTSLSFSHNIHQPLSLSSGKFIFFIVHQDQFDHLKNIFLLLVSFDI